MERTLIVTDQGPYTGVGTYARAVYELLYTHVDRLRLVSTSYTNKSVNPPFESVPGARIGTGILGLARAASFNRRKFRETLKVDEVNLHICGVDYSLARYAKRAIGTLHDYYFRPPDPSPGRTLRGIERDQFTNLVNLRTAVQVDSLAAIVVPSIHAQQQVRRLLNVSSQVIHHWVDRTVFFPRDRLAARRCLGLPENGRLLLVVGGETWNKNLPTIAAISRALPTGHFVLKIGSPLQSGGRTINVGTADSASYPLYFSAADLYLHASIEEGFGIPLIEAMASGLPVVATDRATSREILDRSGVLIEDPKQPRQFLDGISRALDPSERESLVAAALERSQAFDPGVAFEAMSSLYRETFGSPS